MYNYEIQILSYNHIPTKLCRLFFLILRHVKNIFATCTPIECFRFECNFRTVQSVYKTVHICMNASAICVWRLLQWREKKKKIVQANECYYSVKLSAHTHKVLGGINYFIFIWVFGFSDKENDCEIEREEKKKSNKSKKNRKKTNIPHSVAQWKHRHEICFLWWIKSEASIVDASSAFSLFDEWKLGAFVLVYAHLIHFCSRFVSSRIARIFS